MSNKLNIGLFGFGCVGQGLYHVLNNSTGFKADIVKIAVKHKNKPRSVPEELITYDKWDIINDPGINVVVELIDDAEEAYHIVTESLKRGKHVVTANKKLLAFHLEELCALQKSRQVSLLYEGAVCASIPIVRILEEYFDNEALEKVSGIFNGTTNYILTRIIRERLSYQAALASAQEKGFAETDPASDVEGFDPKYKAAILALHAFGLGINPASILNIGITGLQEEDIHYAREKGYRIKLTPVIRRIGRKQLSVFVIPRFVKEDEQLFNVENEFNGVVLEGRFSGEQFLQGKGAGSYPTGAAVLSDISALSYGYKYEYKKYAQHHGMEFTNDVLIDVYFRYTTIPDLENIEFAEIRERYTGTGFSYLTGSVYLQSLLRQKEQLRKKALFVALLNDKVDPVFEEQTEETLTNKK